MTYLISIDPGLNSGIAWGYYDAITPYRLLERWQVYDGLPGFVDWWQRNITLDVDEVVCEKFILANNDFVADTTPLLIEGALHVLNDLPIIWQTRQDKASLIGYPPEADTPDKRERMRFKFLERHGMFKPGTENDDSHDAITHALVSLKRRRHMPSMLAFWPPRAVKPALD